MHAIKDLEEFICKETTKWNQGGVPDRTVGQVKVQRKHHSPDTATWESEDAMLFAHPFLFNLEEH